MVVSRRVRVSLTRPKRLRNLDDAYQAAILNDGRTIKPDRLTHTKIGD